jgi:hypothetical protein
LRYQVRLKHLPLAVYREIAAHLQLLDGVQVELISQRSPDFDYSLSQIDYLEICYSAAVTAKVQQQAQRILAYYGDRYGTWEILEELNAQG